MRDFIFPIVLAAFIIVDGVFLAVQPIVDPGYVHPLALCLTGMGAAIIGGAFLVWALMAALLDSRESEWSRTAAELSTRHIVALEQARRLDAGW